MAVSLEAACFLWLWLHHAAPASVADLGSGFSSYVFRAYRLHCARHFRIVTVDDNPRWLDKTAEFLADYQLPADDLLSWGKFQKTSECFDLVFHDLGNMETRALTLPTVMTRANEGGILVLDDCHYLRYWHTVSWAARTAGVRPFLARQWTIDGYGRFLGIVPLNKRQESRWA